MSRAWYLGLLVGLLLGQGPTPVVYEGPARGPWLVIESGPILVYYTAGQEATAKQAALYARDAYEELVSLFDFQPEGPIALRLHPTLYSYSQTPRWQNRTHLSTLPNLAEIAWLTDKPAFIGQIRSEVAALFLMYFYYGSGVRFQNRVLLYLPDWFLWGFAFFWGEGWTHTDRSRLSLEYPYHLSRLWERTAEPSPVYRSMYKVIWYWLYRTYGQKKLIDLLYMVRLTRQVSEALALTLNISEEELTEKWLNFLRELRESVEKSEASFSSVSELDEMNVVGAAASPKGDIAAAVWDEKGKRIQYWHISPTEGSMRLPGNFPWLGGAGYYGFYEIDLPLAYSPQGKLSWLSYTSEGAVVWVWNPQTNAGARSYRLSLKGVSSLAWKDEETLLLAGREDGDAQVYEFLLRQERLRPLTQSSGDKREVFWAGKRAYYFWQADSLGRGGYREGWGTYGWAEGTSRWIYWESMHDWGGGWLKRNDTILAAQNLESYWRPWIIAPDTMYASGWAIPSFIRWIGSDEKSAYFLYYHPSGGRRVGSITWEALLQGGKGYPDVYAAEWIQMRLQRLVRYPSAPQPTPSSLPPSSDTVSQDTPRKNRSAFYYFDEEFERPRRRSRRTMMVVSPRNRYFYPESVSVQSRGRVFSQGLWEGIRVVPALHPLMRLGLYIHTGVETFSGRYYAWGAWMPYVNLRSSELWLGFQKRTGLWRPYLQAHRQMHYFSATRYGQGLRILSWAGEAGLRVFVEPRGEWEVSAAGLLLDSRRYDLILRDQIEYNAQASWFGGRIEVAHKKYLYREAFLWRGRSLIARGELYRQGAARGLGLLMLGGTWHQPLTRWLVGDLIGQAALGSQANSRYFLLGGIPNWVNYEVQNRAQIPLLGPVGGYYLNSFVSLPGYPYHARRGRHLLLSGVALRIPVLAIAPPATLPTRPIYTLQWKVAFYAATTWSTGNPFSQKNPIDAEYIYRPPLVISVQTLRSPFLLSAGTSLIFRVMGLPLEASLYWPIEEGQVGKPQFLMGFQAPLP